MITKGVGFPVVVVPGIQGRWEWMAPTIDALKAGHRVVSFSLTELRPKRERNGAFLEWMRAMDAMLDRTHERKLSLIGVSFGGLIAACYAARRPDRVSALILVSPPSPVFHARPGDGFCLRFPRLGFPYFALRGARSLGPELYRARTSWPQRIRLGIDYTRRAMNAPFSPLHAAQWVREWQAFDISDDCRKITAPTLVITGDPQRDRVVPVEHSVEYTRLIRGATHSVLSGTGHVGIITKPQRFAELAGQFIYAANSAERNQRFAGIGDKANERARHAS